MRIDGIIYHSKWGCHKGFSNMLRAIVFIMSVLSLNICAAHDAQYYHLHPSVLQKTIEQCPEKHPRSLSCEQLKDIAVRINELVYALHQDPQEYGKKILSLQETVAQQEAAIKAEPKRVELRNLLAKNQWQLQESLAIITWLEAPTR